MRVRGPELRRLAVRPDGWSGEDRGGSPRSRPPGGAAGDAGRDPPPGARGDGGRLGRGSRAALQRVLRPRDRAQRRSGRADGGAGAQAAVPPCRGRWWRLVVRPHRRRGRRDRGRGRAGRAGRVQRGRRPARPGAGLAARAGRGPRCETAEARPAVAGAHRGRRGGDGHDDRLRGASNARAKRGLGWELRYPSWRLGFTKGPG
jgi:hypothetical protein